jgi:hypothetical protein
LFLFLSFFIISQTFHAIVVRALGLIENFFFILRQYSNHSLNKKKVLFIFLSCIFAFQICSFSHWSESGKISKRWRECVCLEIQTDRGRKITISFLFFFFFSFIILFFGIFFFFLQWICFQIRMWCKGGGTRL